MRKHNLSLHLQDEALRGEIEKRVSADVSLPDMAAESPGEETPSDIAVTDSQAYASSVSEDTLVIFVSESPVAGSFFANIRPAVDEIVQHLKKASSYLEVIRVNQEARLQADASASLPELVQSLAGHLRQLHRQAQMRTALVDQLPLPVVGLDDQKMIAYANTLALEVFDETMLGRQGNAVFPEEVVAAVGSDSEDVKVTLAGKAWIVKRTLFSLDDSEAGTILVFIEQEQK